jgi:hypothetical protein
MVSYHLGSSYDNQARDGSINVAPCILYALFFNMFGVPSPGCRDLGQVGGELSSRLDIEEQDILD